MGLQIALQKLKVDGGQCFFKVGNYETIMKSSVSVTKCTCNSVITGQKRNYNFDIVGSSNCLS